MWNGCRKRSATNDSQPVSFYLPDMDTSKEIKVRRRHPTPHRESVFYRFLCDPFPTSATPLLFEATAARDGLFTKRDRHRYKWTWPAECCGSVCVTSKRERKSDWESAQKKDKIRNESTKKIKKSNPDKKMVITSGPWKISTCYIDHTINKTSAR